ncbi:MAG: oligosaccharide flippase family protein [Promethearchaeota archaeon]
MDTGKSTPLVEKAVKSGAGLLLSKLIADGLGFTRTVLLSLFLLPTDFGVVGFSILLSSTIYYFSEIGLESAIVQKKGNIDAKLNAVWTFNVIRSVIIAILLVILSPNIAKLFSVGSTPQERKNLFVSIIAVSIFSLTKGAKNIGLVYLRKNVQFKKIIMGDVLSQLISFSVSLLLVLFIHNYIAYLAGIACFYLSDFVISYVIHPFRPRLTSKIGNLKDLFGYSKWIYLSGFLIFMLVQMDDYIVSMTLGVASLGVYQLAYQIACVPPTEFVGAITQVSFPAYASIQNEPGLLKIGILKNIEVVSLISIPFYFLLLLFSNDLVHLILNPEWYFLIPVIQILGIWGCTWSFGATFSSFFNAIGKPSLTTKTQILQATIMYSLLVPFLYYFGLLGVCASIVIAGFISMLIRIIIVKRILNLSWWEATKNISFVLALLVSTSTAHLILDIAFFVDKTLLIVIIQLIIFTTIFCALALLLERFTSFRFIKIGSEILKTVFQKKRPVPN